MRTGSHRQFSGFGRSARRGFRTCVTYAVALLMTSTSFVRGDTYFWNYGTTTPQTGWGDSANWLPASTTPFPDPNTANDFVFGGLVDTPSYTSEAFGFYLVNTFTLNSANPGAVNTIRASGGGAFIFQGVSAGITQNNVGQFLITGDPILLNNTLTLNTGAANTGKVTIESVIRDGSGSNGVTINGTGGVGTWEFRGENEFTGPLTINSGRLIANRASAGIPNVGTGVLGTGTVNLNNATLEIASTFGTAQNIVLGTGSRIQVNLDQVFAASGIISGANNLTVDGPGMMNLGVKLDGSPNTVANTYTGATVINNGTVYISNNNQLGTGSGAANIQLNGGVLRIGNVGPTNAFTLATNRGITLGAAGGQLSIDAGITATYSGVITGAGGFRKTGEGLLHMNGVSTYTGATEVHQGILRLTGPSNVANNTLNPVTTMHVNAGATLQLNSVASGPAAYNNFIFSALTGTGTVSSTNSGNTTGVRLTIQSANDSQFDGHLAHFATDGATQLRHGFFLDKRGTGTFTLTGANTYSNTFYADGLAGVTTIHEGTLKVANTTGSATGTGRVNVENGGRLAGANVAGQGFISGFVTVNSGGTIVGTSGGTLTLNGPDGLTLQNGAIVEAVLGTPSRTALINVTAANKLIIQNSVNLNLIEGIGFNRGIFRLFDYEGVLPNPLSNLVLPTAPAGYIYELINDTGETAIDLRIRLDRPVKTWNGTVGGAGGSWEVGGPTNWLDASNNPATYDQAPGVPGDTVVFTDAAANKNVVVAAGGVDPESFTVNNSAGAANAYTFSGGPITGAGYFTKTGAGSVTLSGANTFSGEVYLNEGTTTIDSIGNIGQASALGSGDRLAIATGSTASRLEYNSGSAGTSNRSVVIGAGGATIAVNAPSLNLSGKIIGSGSFTKTGAGNLNFGNDTNTYSGTVDIQQGNLSAAQTNQWGLTKIGTASNGAGLSYTGSGNARLANGLTLGTGGTNTVGVTQSGASLTLVKPLTGGNLTVGGAGTVVLQENTNTHANTVINSGTLLAQGNSTLGAGAVTLGGGTLALQNFNVTATDALSLGFLNGTFAATSLLANPTPVGTITTVTSTDPFAPNGVYSGNITTATPANSIAGYGSFAPNQTHVYTGQVWVGESGKLSFAENFSEAVSIKIDGVTVLNNGSATTASESGQITLAANSWHDFEARLSRGGQATSGPGSGWLIYGVGFDPTGQTTGTARTGYQAIQGTGLFRAGSNGSFNSTNAINLTANSTIDTSRTAVGGVNSLGVLTATPGTTLSIAGNAGRSLNLAGLNVSGSGVGFNVDGGALRLGVVNNGGAAGSIIDVNGPGRVELNNAAATASNLTGSVVRVNAGSTLGIQTLAGANNAMGGGSIQLNGGTLNAFADVTLGLNAKLFINSTGRGITNEANMLANVINVAANGTSIVGKTLLGSLSLPTDDAVGQFFGGPGAVVGTTGQPNTNFTASFDGYFIAEQTGTYSFRMPNHDDTGVIWLDLNTDGIFQANERLATGGCCSLGVVGTAALTAGTQYRFATAVEDTGGGGYLVTQVAAPTTGSPVWENINTATGNTGGSWNTGTGTTVVAEFGTTAINVTTDSRINVNRATSANFGALTLQNGVTLTMQGAKSNFASTTLAGSSATIDVTASSSNTYGNLTAGTNPTLNIVGNASRIQTFNGTSFSGDLNLNVDAGTVRLGTTTNNGVGGIISLGTSGATRYELNNTAGANALTGSVVRVNTGTTLGVKTVTGGANVLGGGSIELNGGTLNASAEGQAGLTAKLWLGSGRGITAAGTLQTNIADAAAPFTTLAPRAISFGSDDVFSAYFGAPTVAAGGGNANFTASFDGYFTPTTSGNFNFAYGGSDDNSVIWIDLNDNGVFDLATEKIVDKGVPTLQNSTVALIAGRHYRFVAAMEDTGGGSNWTANMTPPGGSSQNINSGLVQGGTWTTGPGTSFVASFATTAVNVVTSSAINITSADRADFGALSLTDGVTLSITGRPVTFASTTLLGSTATIDSAGSMALGAINAPGQFVLTKTGVGDVILNDTSLSTPVAAGSLINMVGGTLQIRGGAGLSSPLRGASVQLNGVGTRVSIQSSGGNPNPITGAIIANQNSSIGLDAAVVATLGSVTNGVTINGPTNLTFDAVRNSTLNVVGAVTGSDPGSAVSLDGFGTINFNSTISAGTLNVGGFVNSTITGSGTFGTVNQNGGVLTANGGLSYTTFNLNAGTFRANPSAPFNFAGFNINGPAATLHLNGVSQNIDNLNPNVGIIATGNGTVTLNNALQFSRAGSIVLANSVGAAGTEGRLVLGAGGIQATQAYGTARVDLSNGPGFRYGALDLGSVNRTIAVGNGTAAFDLAINAVVAGSGGFTKTGAGALALSGRNTFTGNVNIAEGDLAVSGNTALGAASNVVTMGAGTSLRAYGSATVANNIAFHSTGLVVDTNQASGFANNGITLNGQLTGGNITKIGNAGLTINGSGHSIGNIIVKEGVVQVNHASAVTGSITVDRFAEFNLNVANYNASGLVVGRNTVVRIQQNQATGVGPTAPILGILETSAGIGAGLGGGAGLTLGTGGTLRVNSTYDSNLTVVGDYSIMNINGNSTDNRQMAGIVAGAAGTKLYKQGGAIADMRGINTFAGHLVADGGTINLNGLAGGTLGSVSDMTLFSLVRANNTAQTVAGGQLNRISDTAVINMRHGGIFDVVGSNVLTVASQETLGTVNARTGNGTFRVTRQTTASMLAPDLNITNLVRSVGATVNFQSVNSAAGTTLGSVGDGGAGRIFITGTNPIAAAPATTTTTNSAITPWAIENSRSWAVYGANGVVGLADTNYVGTLTAGQNVSLPGTAVPATLAADLSINSLRFVSSGADTSKVLTVNSNLTITSGGILSVNNTTPTATSWSISGTGKIITAGELVVNHAATNGVANNFHINTAIQSQGLTMNRMSSGTMTITNANNDFGAGDIFINGQAEFNNAAGSPAGTHVLKGTGDFHINGTMIIRHTSSSTTGYDLSDRDFFIHANSTLQAVRNDGSSQNGNFSFGTVSIDQGRSLTITSADNYRLSFNGFNLAGEGSQLVVGGGSNDFNRPFQLGALKIDGISTLNIGNNGLALRTTATSLSGSAEFWTKNNSGALHILGASAAGYNSNINVDAGALYSVANGLGTGTVTVHKHATVRLDAPTAGDTGNRARIVVSDLGYSSIGGDLTGYTFNQAAAPNNIVVHNNTIVGGGPSVTTSTDLNMAAGAKAWFAPNSYTGSYTVDKTGSFKGFAFSYLQGPNGQVGTVNDFSGSLSAVAGQDLDIYTNNYQRFRASSTTTGMPEFNSGTGIVNIYGNGRFDFVARSPVSLGGNWTTINRYGEGAISQNTLGFYLTRDGSDTGVVIGAGQTLNLYDTRFQSNWAGGITGTVNFNSGSSFFADNANQTTGTYNFNPGSALFINSASRLTGGAKFNFATGSMIVLRNSLDMTAAQMPQNVDFVMDRNDGFSFTGAGLVLGENNRLTTAWNQDGTINGGPGISAAAGATRIMLAAHVNRTLNYNTAINMTGDYTLYINDPNQYSTVAGADNMQRQLGTQTGQVLMGGGGTLKDVVVQAGIFRLNTQYNLTGDIRSVGTVDSAGGRIDIFSGAGGTGFNTGSGTYTVGGGGSILGRVNEVGSGTTLHNIISQTVVVTGDLAPGAAPGSVTATIYAERNVDSTLGGTVSFLNMRLQEGAYASIGGSNGNTGRFGGLGAGEGIQLVGNAAFTNFGGTSVIGNVYDDGNNRQLLLNNGIGAGFAGRVSNTAQVIMNHASASLATTATIDANATVDSRVGTREVTQDYGTGTLRASQGGVFNLARGQNGVDVLSNKLAVLDGGTINARIDGAASPNPVVVRTIDNLAVKGTGGTLGAIRGSGTFPTGGVDGNLVLNNANIDAGATLRFATSNTQNIRVANVNVASGTGAIVNTVDNNRIKYTNANVAAGATLSVGGPFTNEFTGAINGAGTVRADGVLAYRTTTITEGASLATSAGGTLLFDTAGTANASNAGSILNNGLVRATGGAVADFGNKIITSTNLTSTLTPGVLAERHFRPSAVGRTDFLTNTGDPFIRFENTLNFLTAPPGASGTLSGELNFNSADLLTRSGFSGSFDNFGSVWYGTITVGGTSALAAGDITFGTNSDDGSSIYIDKAGDGFQAGDLVVNNLGPHGVVTQTGNVNLAAGTYNIAIGFYNGSGGVQNPTMQAKFASGLSVPFASQAFINPALQSSIFAGLSTGSRIQVDANSTVKAGAFEAEKLFLTGTMESGTAGVSNVSVLQVIGNASVLNNAGTVNSTSLVLPAAATFTKNGAGTYNAGSTSIGGAAASAYALNVNAGTMNLNGALNTTANTTVNKNGAGNLTISGTQTHGAGAIINANAGITNINSNGGTNLTVNAKSTAVDGASFGTNFGSSQTLAAVNIDAGATAALTQHGGHVLSTSALTIAGATGAWTGRLELNDNDMIVKGTAANAATNAARVLDQVKQGHGGDIADPWTGTTGITSAAARDFFVNNGFELTAVGTLLNVDLGALGFTEHTVFSGEAVDSFSTLTKYTYTGDANLDGKVDADDFALIENGFAFQSDFNWVNGDFNYDGQIDADDFAAIENAFQFQDTPLSSSVVASVLADSNAAYDGAGAAAAATGPDPFVGTGGSSLVAVPEPGSMTLILLGLLCGAGVWRRKKGKIS